MLRSEIGFLQKKKESSKRPSVKKKPTVSFSSWLCSPTDPSYAKSSTLVSVATAATPEDIFTTTLRVHQPPLDSGTERPSSSQAKGWIRSCFIFSIAKPPYPETNRAQTPTFNALHTS
jgi:hypothetical protein